MLGPALYDKCPTGAIPKPGKDAIVSISFLLFVAEEVSGSANDQLYASRFDSLRGHLR